MYYICWYIIPLSVPFTETVQYYPMPLINQKRFTGFMEGLEDSLKISNNINWQSQNLLHFRDIFYIYIYTHKEIHMIFCLKLSSSNLWRLTHIVRRLTQLTHAGVTTSPPTIHSGISNRWYLPQFNKLRSSKLSQIKLFILLLFLP